MATSRWKKAKQALSCLYPPSTDDDSPPPLPPPPPLSPDVGSGFSNLSFNRNSGSGFSTLFSNQNTGSAKKTCAICLMSMKPGKGHAIFTAECSHSFHFHCITSNVKHGNQICPICRATWKEIPFHSPISSNPRTRPSTAQGDDAYTSVIQRMPHHRTDGRHISTAFHALEPSVFDDDELIDPQPEPTGETNADNSNSNSVSGSIEVETIPEVSEVSKSASRKNFTILVHLKALTNTIRVNSRAPIDLVTVLDVSGSMAGTKLALLKRAMGFVIQHLGPNDRLSVVAFSSNARRLFPLRRMTHGGRQEALLMVNNLTSNGGTNISDGLKKGVKILTDRKWKNPVVSIILLSDGQDTYTTSSPGGTHRALLPVAAQSDGGDGLRIPVHAFGFGADHDAAAMHSISEGSGGTFSFIETESVIQDAFAQCIGGLLSVVVQELEVGVECLDSKILISCIKAGSYKTHMTPDSRRGYINVGDLYAEEEKDFLVMVDIPEDSSSDDMSLLKVHCVYRDPFTKESMELNNPEVLKIPRPETTGDLTVSIEVDRQRNRLRGAEAMAEAKTKAEHGDLSGAVTVLECFLKELSESVSAKAGDSLCVGLAADVKAMQERMGNRRAYECSGRAYVLSGMSSHSWQRATARGDSTDSTSIVQAYQTPSMTSMVTRSQTLFLGGSSPPLPYRRGGSFASVKPR